MTLNKKYTISNFSLFSIASVLLCVISLVACKKDPKTTDPVPKIDSPSISTPNIYIVGCLKSNFKIKPVLWTNGTPTFIGDTNFNSTAAQGLFVDGNDVYVCGYDSKQAAIYWKNGIAIKLTDGLNEAFAKAIYVNGKDVYVAGYESNGKKRIAKVWKNGLSTSLTKGNEDASADAFVVQGSDLYVYGFNERFVSTYWKDGIEININLPKGAKNVVSNTRFLDGIDIYNTYSTFNGSDYFIQIRKNNILIDTISITKNRTYPKSMFVKDSIIYIIGEEFVGPNEIVKLWVNGKESILTQNGSSFSIFVK